MHRAPAIYRGDGVPATRLICLVPSFIFACWWLHYGASVLLFAAAPVKVSQTKLYLHVFSIMIANSRISDGDKDLSYLLLSVVIACRQHVLICVLLLLW